MIKINSLSKKYNSLEVLRELDFDLSIGEVHGIVGVNGAGKTTLFNCLAGMEKYEGSIEYSGELTAKSTAYLPTRPFLMSHITGEEYLRLIANASDVSLDNFNEKNVFNLPLDRYASTYSTGMQKKLAISGLLIGQHHIFLFDEPFNGVDMESNILIQALIAKLKSKGKTVIIASHIFKTLEHCCDRIHHLEKGKIARSYNRSEYQIIDEALQKSIGLERIEALSI